MKKSVILKKKKLNKPQSEAELTSSDIKESIKKTEKAILNSKGKNSTEFIEAE